MRAIAGAAPVLAGEAGERAARALQMRAMPLPFDRQAGRAELVVLADAPAGWPRPEAGRTRWRQTTRTRARSGRPIRPPIAAREEPALVVDVEGFEGPLDLLLVARAQPEGRHHPHLDPRAGRAVPRLHREDARAAPGACRRLPRDGGVARLPQVAAAAAGAPRARSRPARSSPPSLPSGSAGSKRCATPRRGLPTATGSAATSSPAGARADVVVKKQRVSRRRSTISSRPTPRAARSGRLGGACARARGLVAPGRPRRAGPHRRPDRRMDAAGRSSCRPISSARDARAASPRARSAPASSWCARARSISARPNLSRRSTSATAQRAATTYPGGQKWLIPTPPSSSPSTTMPAAANQSPEDRRAGPAHGRGAAVRRRRAAVGRRHRRRVCRRAPTSPGCCASCSSTTPTAASTSSRSPANGCSAPPATSRSCSAAMRSSRGACRGRRWRRWRSSPTTSRSPAPRSRRSAASPPARARSTCCWRRAGSACAAGGGRPGRPVTYGTTEAFLAHFGLDTRGRPSRRRGTGAAGLLDSRVPAEFRGARAACRRGLAPDEDPLGGRRPTYRRPMLAERPTSS